MMNPIYPIIGRQASMPFYLTGIGTSNPEYHVDRENGLISHQFLFTSQGEGILKVQGNSYVQKMGSLFYLAPGIAHEYYPSHGNWTTNWLVFRGNQSIELMKDLGFSQYEMATELNLSQFITIFQRIQAAAQDPISGGEKSSVLIYEFIIRAREVLVSKMTEHTGIGSIVDEAIKYINQNYSKDITLEELAVMSKVSLQHFCRVFKAKMGMRPMEYVARVRIMEAKVLLMNSYASIKSIGKAVGYEDQNYFGIVFKKYEGISPSDFKRQKWVI